MVFETICKPKHILVDEIFNLQRRINEDYNKIDESLKTIKKLNKRYEQDTIIKNVV